jgi:hypothetical protein
MNVVYHIQLLITECKDNKKEQNRQGLWYKKIFSNKKVAKYLELSGLHPIFAPSERKFWLSG